VSAAARGLRIFRAPRAAAHESPVSGAHEEKQLHIEHADLDTLATWETELAAHYAELRQRKLSLDLTRGKPSSEQLDLSDPLDGALDGGYSSENGVDLRNYGVIDGIPEAKRLFAEVLQVAPDNMLIGGNSSLTLMYQCALFGLHFGFEGPDSAWSRQGPVRFLCPVPGYDRHFSVCEHLGIELLSVPMHDSGPDMDAVERLVGGDHSIRGMWCVPRFSNPTGTTYDDATVERCAALGARAAPGFRIFWDNAYAVHALQDSAPRLAPIYAAARRHGTEDSVLIFGSTSKITYAGAGVAFMAASARNLGAIRHHMGFSTIGPDKINQKRHVQFLRDFPMLLAHMKRHAEILRPRFDLVLDTLQRELGGTGMGRWSHPLGGYFISFDTLPGLARQVVQMAAEAGVKLTPAGATFPYGKDPTDSNIRIAPSFPSPREIAPAMEVFAVCVKLASVRQRLGKAAD
jgi:aspartate/methionine/tyrosine aminotransferase